MRYTYAIVALDANGNRSKSVALAATPQASKLVSPAAGSSVASPPTLLWVPVAGASYYNVQLFRGGTKILSIWPGSTRLTLKRHWVFSGRAQALVPGSYTWYVWPGFGPHKAKKYGSLLGSSSFKLTG